MSIVNLNPSRFDAAVAALSNAFHDYPVMRYVIGDAGDDYDRLLVQLVSYFTESRFCRGYPVLGVESEAGKIVAAANINPPKGLPAPDSLKKSYERLCESLGAEAIVRYQAFADACQPFEPEEPHYHLGMIGVIREAQGKGHARHLLDALHEMSAADDGSNGVSLTTETPRNLPFYEHFGYRILGSAKTPDAELETWTLFRPDA